MNHSTTVGLVAGAIFIVISIFLGGDISRYYDLPSIMIVMGGTAAATMVSYSFAQLRDFGRQLREVFYQPAINLDSDLEQVIELANKARREGLLSLDGETFPDACLQKGIELIVDGTDPELVREILEAEISRIEEKDAMAQKILGSMAQYAPAFGMVGTLIGLINMLMFLEDSSTLGPSMATALITTFYGVILANLLFLPFAAKLKSASESRINRMSLILEGVLSIQSGDNPRIIREKLRTYLSGAAAPGKASAQSKEGAEHAQETLPE